MRRAISSRASSLRKAISIRLPRRRAKLRIPKSKQFDHLVRFADYKQGTREVAALVIDESYPASPFTGDIGLDKEIRQPTGDLDASYALAEQAIAPANEIVRACCKFAVIDPDEPTEIPKSSGGYWLRAEPPTKKGRERAEEKVAQVRRARPPATPSHIARPP